MVPWNSASGGFTYNWQSKWVGIISIKTEKTQIHFLSDVLVAVARWILKSLICSASAWASVILAEKRDSGRHCITSFSENIEVAETNYQMLDVLSFRDLESLQ